MAVYKSEPIRTLADLKREARKVDKLINAMRVPYQEPVLFLTKNQYKEYEKALIGSKE